ncbi:MAG: phage tail sheath family protein [Leptonema illini]|uniref:Phage tail sheath family protein n=1 Tax=Leptonema illini TaxID=183 RepID=A0A833GZ37_9LEPT|nr:MAG: phage tail sheath family protein [Leptonema illini]
MPSYLSPGVYLEEVPSGVQPLEGVGTSTGAFVGRAERGVLDTPVLITNFTQFVTEFGSFMETGYLAYAVYSFFAEGGSRCYVVRVAASDAVKATMTIADGTDADLFTVDAASAGAWGNSLKLTIADPSSASATTHFKMVIQDGDRIEEFDNLSLDSIESKVNGISTLVTVHRLAAVSGRPANGTLSFPESGETGAGSDGTGTVDYTGTSSNRKGLSAFDVIDDINIVAIPDIAGQRSDILAAMTYCDNRKDCFFLVDPPKALAPTAVSTFKSGTGAYTGQAFDSANAALYYPWVMIQNPVSKVTITVPPSGVVAGTFSATDSLRGVHKAPAGTSDGYLNSVVGIERLVTKGEQDVLNPSGINVIRSFPGSGIAIWGARTLSSMAEWRYVNVRRLMMYIKESLDAGTQFVVFEPNSPVLWGQVRRTISAFLTRVWRDGALFGTKPEEAFFVKVDEENNPQEVRDAGQLVIEVGVAPVKPAEFVIIRISQQTQSTN